MSNKKSKSKSSASKNTPQKALNPSDLQGLAKVKWSLLQTDLQSAMGSWSDSDHDKVAKSPEQEQLEKVRSLIEDLKERLNEF
ncbi:MAG: hypothetical protein V4654_13055 [Bdellovibrionota bacterium]